jgi:hypothetical protein
VPFDCPVTSVVYADVVSEAGLTVAIDVFPEEKSTLSTVPFWGVTVAVNVWLEETEIFARLGVKSTVQVGDPGGGVGGGGVGVPPGPQQPYV